jgi:hypothetical protein
MLLLVRSKCGKASSDPQERSEVTVVIIPKIPATDQLACFVAPRHRGVDAPLFTNTAATRRAPYDLSKLLFAAAPFEPAHPHYIELSHARLSIGKPHLDLITNLIR